MKILPEAWGTFESADEGIINRSVDIIQVQ